MGLIDFGGSSLQVVGEIDEPEEDELFMRSKIGPLEHQILAYSLPACGLNEAFDRTVIMLSHSQALRESDGGILEVSHPCLSSNFVQNYTCRGCFGLTFIDSESSHSQEQKNEFNSIFIVGEPNWEQCKLLARAAAINSSSSEWSRLTDSSKCKAGWASLSGEFRGFYLCGFGIHLLKYCTLLTSVVLKYFLLLHCRFPGRAIAHFIIFTFR